MLSFDVADLPAFPAVLTAVIGGGMTRFGVWLRANARAMQRWPAVQGTVIQSRVEEHVDRPTSSDDFPQTLYRPIVVYDYMVNERAYRGQRIDIAEGSASWSSYAEGIVARYPVGSAVTVFYNPASPPDAILERASAPSWAASVTMVGVVLLAGGLLWIVVPLVF